MMFKKKDKQTINKDNINLFANTIKKAYEQKDVNTLKKMLKNRRIDLVVQALEHLNDAQLTIFCLITAKDDRCGEIFKFLNHSAKLIVIQSSTISQLKIILFELYNDDIVDLTYQFPKEIKKILLSLDSQQRAALNQMTEYDQDEAGSLINSEFYSLNINWTIEKAVADIKKQYDNFERNNFIFVVDEFGRLKGLVGFNDLFFAQTNNQQYIKDIMQEDVFYLRSDESVDQVIEIFSKYSIEQLAVIDQNDRLLGYISDNDILPVINEETTEDIYKMYGMKELDFPYMKTSVITLFKSRLLWLAILLISATITSFLISKFQDIGQVWTAGLSSLVIVPIIPAMTGTSGNAGSQTAASVIRALSIGEITKKEFSKVMWKEFLVGNVVGLVLAIINFVRLVIFFLIIKPEIQQGGDYLTTIQSPIIIGTIVSAGASLALWISIVLSKVLGALLPIIATKFKVDPTVMSTPILATLLDMVTSTILFSICIGFLIIVIDQDVVNNINNSGNINNTNSVAQVINFIKGAV
ncbi:magnesium transporter [Ureaplasma zalophigenitalium]|uniref:Magnesium transporter MgtE n=1 Tax=Ureaplasma zalophigenitalium TaxID=907723 RepID=A0ABT3BNQ0_9BACT|nr:magnesium transporter [Ureaplasma zalophigenitalium]MCV3753864.1 magnesium transporter [Ureaplasma zalophigenitalium]